MRIENGTFTAYILDIGILLFIVCSVLSLSLADSLSILCSPDFQMKPALHTKSWVERSPEQQTKLVKMLKFPDSPLPPLLHTPGTKQIPHLSQFVSLDQVIIANKSTASCS